MGILRFADSDVNGNINAYYCDDIWDTAKVPASAIIITEAQYQDSKINQQKYIIDKTTKTMVLAPAPSAASLLATAKANKTAELNAACNKTVLGRFKSTVASVAYEFSYDVDNQSNLDKFARAFDKAMITSVSLTAYEVGTGKVVRLNLTAAQFDVVFKDSLTHLNTNIGKFRDTLSPKVEAAVDVPAVNAIVW